MICPGCGFKIDALPCEHCESEAKWREQFMQELAEKHSLVRGAPDSDEARASLDFALARLQRRFSEESFEGTIPYDARDLLRHPRWWYIPMTWIGCSGFIVSLDNGYVNWLGSAISLDDCFWGHERGLFCDTVDFSFAPNTDLELAGKLLKRFKKEEPDSRDDSGEDFVWYGRREIESTLAAHFPTFRRHFVWFAIPELRAACEQEGLEFRCVLSASTEQR